MRKCRAPTCRHGFSLTEMLVVVGVLIIVTGLLLPAVMRARKVSKQTQCASNLREIGHLVLMYCDANEDYAPFGLTVVPRFKDHIELIRENWTSRFEWTCYVAAGGAPSANIGVLMQAGLVSEENCKMLYCPLDPDTSLQWSAWRGKFPSRKGTLAPDTTIRISYFARPINRAWLHTMMPPPATQVNWPNLLAHFDDFRGKAIFTERLLPPAAHGTESAPRINVLYQDGSVRSVPLSNLYGGGAGILPNHLPPDDVASMAPLTMPDSGVVTLLEGWKSLDRQP